MSIITNEGIIKQGSLSDQEWQDLKNSIFKRDDGFIKTNLSLAEMTKNPHEA